MYEDAFYNLQQEKNLSLKKISYNEIKSNRKVVDKLKKIISKKMSSSIAARAVLNEDFGVYIDTTNIIQINYDDEQTLTFAIVNDSFDSKLENLVLKIKNDGDVKGYISEYILTDQEFETIVNGGAIPYNIKPSSITDIESASKLLVTGPCSTTYTYTAHMCHDANGNEIPSNGELGNNCQGMSYDVTYTVITIDYECLSGGGGNPSNSGSSGDNGNNTGNGGNSNSNDGFGWSSSGSGVVTSPTTMSDAQIKIKKFHMQLTSSQNSCFSSLPDQVKNELNDFVAYTLLPTEEGDTPTTSTENPVYQQAKEMMDQMCGNPGVFNSIVPLLLEKNIDDSELDDCTKGILNAIRNSQNNDIATIIAKLDNSPSIYETKIKSSNLGSAAFGSLGKTNWTGFLNGGDNHTNYDYTIELNSNLLNQGTKLQIYATMLHELIHAYYLSLIDDCYISNISTSAACQLLSTKEYLWQKYVAFKFGNDSTITSSISQHNQLANDYVDMLTNAIHEYAIQIGILSSTPNLDQICQDLAWGGLEGTIPYENNDPLTRKLTDQDRNRIEVVNRAESTNLQQPEYNSNNSGNVINTHIPVGIPCN